MAAQGRHEISDNETRHDGMMEDTKSRENPSQIAREAREGTTLCDLEPPRRGGARATRSVTARRATTATRKPTSLMQTG